MKASPGAAPASQGDLGRLYLASSARLGEDVAEALVSREFERWHQRFSQELFEGHAESWRIGRGFAGDVAADPESDALVARAIVDQESRWSLRFLADLEEGRYDDSPALAVQRAQMYSLRYRGTANRAWVEAGPDAQEFSWVMTAKEHCDDCPTLAALSPWRKDELSYVPGEGGTQCLGNCKCVLVRADGATGFSPF